MNTKFISTESFPSTAKFGLGALAFVYACWIAVMLAIFTVPQLSFLGVFGFTLLLLIWFPWWMFRNWADFVADLSSTYATLTMFIVIEVGATFYFRWDGAFIWHVLVQLGLSDSPNVRPVGFAEFALDMVLYYSVYPLWRLSKAFWAHHLSKVRYSGDAN